MSVFLCTSVAFTSALPQNNKNGVSLMNTPYVLGLGFGVFGALSSIPMVTLTPSPSRTLSLITLML
jgi:hypothetical protein